MDITEVARRSGLSASTLRFYEEKGLIASIGAAALIRGLLFGAKSWDMETFGSVAIVLALSALIASFIPARRAASVNPVDALRSE